ncbi:hypothetical protein MHY1_00327 [Methylovirgula sp. HY1]|nr:hypothetical protein MHY1_00327 [Methylovirgula sp. HY1]
MRAATRQESAAPVWFVLRAGGELGTVVLDGDAGVLSAQC